MVTGTGHQLTTGRSWPVVDLAFGSLQSVRLAKHCLLEVARVKARVIVLFQVWSWCSRAAEAKVRAEARVQRLVTLAP